jgi:hypothetical protein
MSHSDFFVFGTIHKLVIEKGTGDGYFPDFSLDQKIIRGGRRGELIGKDTKTTLSPDPRPLPPDGAP